MWKDYWRRYSGPDYKLMSFFVIIFAIIGGYLLLSFQQPPETITPTPTPQPTPSPTPTEVVRPLTGDLLIAVKDVKQKLRGLGDATELILIIKSIQIHPTADNKTDENVTAADWTTVFEGEKTFDLLKYTDVVGILGEKELSPGNYTQIRLYISDATIRIYNLNMNIFNKTYPMVIPSKILKLVRPFTVEANKTLVLTLDFDVPESVTRTGQGYTLKPVIKIVEGSFEKGKKPSNAVEIA